MARLAGRLRAAPALAASELRARGMTHGMAAEEITFAAGWMMTAARLLLSKKAPRHWLHVISDTTCALLRVGRKLASPAD